MQLIDRKQLSDSFALNHSVTYPLTTTKETAILPQTHKKQIRKYLALFGDTTTNRELPINGKGGKRSLISIDLSEHKKRPSHKRQPFLLGYDMSITFYQRMPYPSSSSSHRKEEMLGVYFLFELCHNHLSALQQVCHIFSNLYRQV